MLSCLTATALSIRIRIAAEIRLPSTQSGGWWVISISRRVDKTASRAFPGVIRISGRFLAARAKIAFALLRLRKDNLSLQFRCKRGFVSQLLSPGLQGQLSSPTTALPAHLAAGPCLLSQLVFLSVLSIKPPPLRDLKIDRSLSLKHGSCSGQSKSALQASREKSGPCRHPGRLYAAKNAGV